jgi:hypothetical protein
MNDFTYGKSHHIFLSNDTSSSGNIVFKVNGEDYSYAGGHLNDGSIGYSEMDGVWLFRGGDTGFESTWMNGSLGEIYLNNTIEDYSNFWDSDTNKPKPVRQVLEETGTTPLIAMPISADDPGNNLGTGGDFTVNSGPYVGARGPSEYLARSVTNGLTAITTASKEDNVLLNTDLGGTTSSSWSLVFSCRTSDTTQSGTTSPLFINGLVIAHGLGGYADNNLLVVSTSSTQNTRVSASFFSTSWKTAFVWCDGSQVHINVNGTTTTGSFTDTYIPGKCVLLGAGGNNFDWVGELGFVYFATESIDFSQESNRLKFLDAFDYPVDLNPAIESGDVPSPLMYMEFKDPSSLGTNSGTGGDFTVIGTVKPSSDVDPS